ncbi:MAG: hypothetical protein Q9202_006305 [Teloschistes flavicans]
MAPEIIFGTATFAMDMTEFQDPISVHKVLKTLHEAGVRRLDSGARYPPLKPGRAEGLIGETKDVSECFLVDTKVYTDTGKDGSGDLTPEAIEKVAVKQSWGVSNTSPERLEEILRICETTGLQKPTCYQGDYNLITRGMETRLLPLLRRHGMTFNAFRPLAAGFLTGKFIHNDHAGTRFGDDNPLGKMFHKLFGAQDLQNTVRDFDSKVKSHGLTPIEVAVRWIAHHSALGDGDGIIIGASKTAQVEETAAMIGRGALPREVVEVAEGVWDAVGGSRWDVI